MLGVLCMLPRASSSIKAGQPFNVCRRSLVSSACAVAVSVCAPVGVHASWLTSEPLEMFRKLEQEAADAKYGELAPINDGRGGGQRLVPLLKLQARLERLAKAATADRSSWAAVRKELGAPEFGTKQLKRDFNLYSDNIYYSDENRANIYLLGGTTPESAQTEQYLLRNDVITAVQNVQAELDYLLAPAQLPAESADASDLADYFASAGQALRDYLQRAETRDLTVARRLLAEGR